jgi:hypothetical protein
MAWSFGDGFDLYAASGDMINGYWVGSSGGLPSLGADASPAVKPLHFLGVLAVMV